MILDPNLFGYPSKDHSLSPVPAVSRMHTFRGLSRYRLKDQNSDAFSMVVSYEWSDELVREFKAFWDVNLRHGAEWFEVQIPFLGGVLGYWSHAKTNYRLTSLGGMWWKLTLELETSAIREVVPTGQPCDIIVAGIEYLDQIVSVITASDVIAPCPRIDPNA